MNDQDLDAQGQAWVEIQALCCSLSISRSALGRLRRRELLRYWHHWVKKSPTATPYGSSCKPRRAQPPQRSVHRAGTNVQAPQQEAA